MRIWHKYLIAVLPDNQLRGQWRECCLIAKALKDGNLNHLLVNKVKEYPVEHLFAYGCFVIEEMRFRGFEVNEKTFQRYFPVMLDAENLPREFEDVFAGWHNDRYFEQCYYNLQEKYDCGGISEEEWREVDELFHDRV